MKTVPASRSLRILVVEDEAILALEIEMLLTEEGHEVVGSADHATRALELAKRERPDLALVDINLTDGLTGPEIAHALIHEHGVPVLFVTSQWSMVAEFEGALGLLQKPFTQETFLDAMRFAAVRLEDGDAPLPLGVRLLGRRDDPPPA